MGSFLKYILAITALLFATGVKAQTLDKELISPSIYKYMVEAAPEHSTMLKAVNAARLEASFESDGPYTVFMPTNQAFAALPAGTADNWLKPEHADSLKKILTAHIVTGNWTVPALEQKIKEGGGSLNLPTVGGAHLTFTLDAGRVSVADRHGIKTVLNQPIVRQNGIIYVIDKLLLP